MKSDLDALMQSRQLDAVLIFGDAEHNPPMYYFVGGGHVSGAFLIKKVGKEAVLFYNDMEREEAAKSGLKLASYNDYGTVGDLISQADGDRPLAARRRSAWLPPQPSPAGEDRPPAHPACVAARDGAAR